VSEDASADSSSIPAGYSRPEWRIFSSRTGIIAISAALPQRFPSSFVQRLAPHSALLGRPTTGAAAFGGAVIPLKFAILII
jgi:hypothetical protein